MLDLLGYEPALMALLDDPDKCKMILNHYTKLIKKLALEMCETGIDAIKVSSPFAGMGFISPVNYEEFVLPYERDIVTAIREKGVHVYIHTCGSIGDRLELMFESGMSGIECLDPEPLGNVKLEEAVDIIADKGFIKGNIDSVNTLLMGTKDEIIKDAKHRIQVGKTHAGFILSTACSIAPAVKRENIQLLKEIADS
jgi:uroporphyrinogen-III decarboxylase